MPSQWTPMAVALNHTTPRDCKSTKVYPDFYGENGNSGAVHRMALEAGHEEAPPSLFLAFFSPAAHFPVPSRQSASQAARCHANFFAGNHAADTRWIHVAHFSVLLPIHGDTFFWRCQGIFVFLLNRYQDLAVPSVVERWKR